MLIVGTELFVLPIDFFTYRVWEALIVRKMHAILSGRFYPRMEIVKMETVGDLFHSPSAVPRRVRWTTDSYGARTKNIEGRKPQVVVIGDSNIYGNGLSQEEIYSEVLEERLKVPVYPYPSMRFQSFLEELRFKQDPPRIVIISRIERDIPKIEFPKEHKNRDKYLTFFRLREYLRQVRWIQWMGVLLDRIYKMNIVFHIRARMGNQPVMTFQPHSSKFGPMYFWQGEEANRPISRNDIKKVVRTLEAHDRILRKRGIRFIFLPIPNKENTYHEFLSNPARPVFLEQLIRELKERKIETVDTQKGFDDEYGKNSTLLFFLNDTHWNANGCQLAADLTAQLILEGKYPLDPMK